jgi:serine/threonine protein kinase
MEYLASRKILHGDLAARNVLLAERNVVKICDFGLAKEMYHEKYKKKSEGVLLPVKWMAIESICLGVFSTQSDVWSFGVVMWELFTLGKTPYPGMEADERFYKMLNDGYRMEKPAYAPSSIYDLMTECWNHEPSARPSFTGLSDRIGDLMEEGLRQHYIDLNCPYTTMNERRMEGREDLLLKMSGPDYGSVSKRGTPDRSYANVAEQNESGYLAPNVVLPHGVGIGQPQYGVSGNYQNLTIPTSEDKRLHSLANNTGYLYMNKNSNDSLGPMGVFSPRPDPTNPHHHLGNSREFNFTNVEAMPSSSTDVCKTDEASSLVPQHSPKEVEGISNMHYVPNTIFSSVDTREMQDILQDASYKTPNSGQLKEPRKRQKNDSGISSIDSNCEGNTKAASPPPPYANSFSGGSCTDPATHHQSQNHVVSFHPPQTILAGGHSE